MQRFANHKPSLLFHGPANFYRHHFGAIDELPLTGFSYSNVDARSSRCTLALDETLAPGAGSRIKPAIVSGGRILSPDLGD